MNKIYQKLLNCYESFRKKIDFSPKIGLVLGSGLGDYAETIDVVAKLDYSEIDGFPVSTVPGHAGAFIFGYVDTVPVVVMKGRVHFYEGYPMDDVILPTRLMKMMGVEILFLTNASGGVNFNFNAGDFMLINDHISSFVDSPLAGENIDELGTRFPDMSCVYDKSLRASIKASAEKLNIPLQEGVYLQTKGPNFETPAEIRMYRTLGADAVGMSTTVEAMAAKHMGMKVCGISCISNLACGMTDNPLSHAEVQETANRVAPLFKKLITESIINIAKT